MHIEVSFVRQVGRLGLLLDLPLEESAALDLVHHLHVLVGAVEDLGDERVGDPRLLLFVRDTHTLLCLMFRDIKNPGVRQCLGFCIADFWSSLAYESAEQKPNHCLTPGFLIPLLMFHFRKQLQPLLYAKFLAINQ